MQVAGPSSGLSGEAARLRGVGVEEEAWKRAIVDRLTSLAASLSGLLDALEEKQNASV